MDSLAQPLRWSDGSIARNRIQAFDSTFGLQRTDRTVLHRQVGKGSSSNWSTQTLTAASRAMVATFDDSKEKQYWSPANPMASVKVAGVGVKATVLKQTDDTITVRVQNPLP